MGLTPAQKTRRDAVDAIALELFGALRQIISISGKKPTLNEACELFQRAARIFKEHDVFREDMDGNPIPRKDGDE